MVIMVLNHQCEIKYKYSFKIRTGIKVQENKPKTYPVFIFLALEQHTSHSLSFSQSRCDDWKSQFPTVSKWQEQGAKQRVRS